MTFDISSSIFLITGSGGGLGKAFAKKLLRLGGRVCISDVNVPLGLKTLEELKQEYGEKVVFVECDVTKEQDLKRLWEEAERKLKGKIDCLINNAGVMGEKEGWKMCMDINLMGVLYGTTLAMDRMSRSSGGCGGTVVNVASILGLFCGTQPKGWAYNTSKSAVVAFSRCIGNQASFSETGVSVLCLCPSIANTPILKGCTDQELTEMNQQVGGFMEPEDVADALIKLINGQQTGQVMSVWNKVPPYLIPDLNTVQFVSWTTCAMMLRWVPGVSVARPWMYPICGLAVVFSWYLAICLTGFLWNAIF